MKRNAIVNCVAAGVFLFLLLAMATDNRAGDGQHLKDESFQVSVSDAVWRDTTRGRDIPVRLYVPGGVSNAPLIIFSHGLGGSRASGEVWLRHWASRGGYVCLCVQHPGSDESVWRGKGPVMGMRSLREAASGEQLIERVRDIRFVLDEAPRRKAAGEPGLRMADLDTVGMSGHSFGAITTQVLAGQGGLGREGRIQAAIAFSPSSRKGAGESAFASITIPFFGLTGTADTLGGSLLGDRDATPEDRRRVFDLLPPGNKYMLVFKDADHMVFGGRADPARERRRSEEALAVSPHVTTVTETATLAFWNLTLKKDKKAWQWLQFSFRSLLGPQDELLTK